MANVKHPGFAPIKRHGATVSLVRKLVLTNNTDRIAKGDALEATSAGDVIAHTTESGAVYSVQWGGASFVTNNERVERLALPASTTYTGTTLNNPLASYVYAVDDTVTTRFRASINAAEVTTILHNNFIMVLTVATGDYSKHELDDASKGTTATNGWRVLEPITGDPKVDPTLTNAHWVCTINAGERDSALEPGGSLGT